MAITNDRIQSMLASLNEGLKNSQSSFANREAYNSAYSYNGKNNEEKALLDFYWDAKEKGIISSSKTLNYTTSVITDLTNKINNGTYRPTYTGGSSSGGSSSGGSSSGGSSSGGSSSGGSSSGGSSSTGGSSGGSTGTTPTSGGTTGTPTTGTTAGDYGTIINNLNEGMKNSPTSFASQEAYKKAYGYDTATPEKKIIMDVFWSSYSKGSINANKPFTYNQEGLNQLVTQMPSLIEQQKANNPDVQVNFDATAYAKNFDEGWDAYTKASKEAYNADTALGQTQYTNAQQDYDTSISRTREDYNKWTTNNAYDFARNIGQYDKSFATQLSQAQNAYGQRGMLNSGLAKKAQQQAIISANEEKGYLGMQNQRNIDTASTSMNRANQDYATNTGRLNTAKSNYDKSRTSGLTVLEAGLKQTGNTLYNTGLIQQWQTLYDTAKQKSLDTLYGRTGTSYTLPLRYNSSTTNGNLIGGDPATQTGTAPTKVTRGY